ncbi:MULTISPECIES: DUF418 domain-containing protein [Pseudoxanthomonas]|jgi:Predicted membrane protein|uniref:DUF418 domain-containing protein n=1 Tax=Pseudoxanthomonas taiwanensis J19 TaxID=935569 RepID=A0A562D5E0_9GAMM|nr:MULTISPECIES: DUF418 domain-containing protein [Pseudoxanthomonas]TWH04792.1 uncharacterized protein L613_000700000410 [Pseudoxanthomonas taiwanensis J19]
MAGSGGARLENLDALRGFALFGLFMVHMPELFELYWLAPVTDPFQLAVHDAVWLVFAGKAFALMALCFGTSFFILMQAGERRGRDFSLRFAWRLLLLAAMGLLHGLWYRGDILEVLAVMGLFLLPFHRVRSNRVLLALAAVLLLQPLMLVQIAAGLAGAEWANRAPAYWSDAINPLYASGSLWDTVRINVVEGHAQKWAFMHGSGRLSQILGLSLAGMVLGRIGFFARPQAFARLRMAGLLLALAAAAVLYFAREPLAALVPASDAMFMPRALAGSLLGSLFDLAVMAVLLFGFLVLYHGPAQPVLRLLAPAGRMTLSLYVGQSLLFVPVFYGYGLGLHASMTQLQAVLWGLAAFAAQLAFAHLWFRHFLYGPLEWLWRAGTWTTLRVPFRRVQGAPA